MVSYKSKKERGINSWSYCSIINVCCWWVTCVNLCLTRVNNIWDVKMSYNKFIFVNNKALLDVKLIFPWKFPYIYGPTTLYHPYDSSFCISNTNWLCWGFAFVPWVTGSTLKQRWAPVGFFECKIEYTVTHI